MWSSAPSFLLFALVPCSVIMPFWQYSTILQFKPTTCASKITTYCHEVISFPLFFLVYMISQKLKVFVILVSTLLLSCNKLDFCWPPTDTFLCLLTRTLNRDSFFSYAYSILTFSDAGKIWPCSRVDLGSSEWIWYED